MQDKTLTRTDLIFFGVISLLAFSLFLGAPPLFDWDEINFAESAREMIATGNYFEVQINYQPFWEKPPLFFWLQTVSMHIFGATEFAARFPNALIGVFTVCVLYWSGIHLKGRLLARLLAGLYLATLLPVIYFKSGIIDPVFNFFIFMGLLQLMRFELLRKADREASKEDAGPWGAGFWIGLATLTKGPVALLVTLLVYGLYKLIFDRFRIPWLAAMKFFVAWTILVAAWYGMGMIVNGPDFLVYFTKYQIELFSRGVAGHEQPFYYHIIVFILGCFPISAFVFRGMQKRAETETDSAVRKFATVWFWAVLILFSLATTKIVHYSSLLYFPAVFLAALYLRDLIRREEKVSWDVYLILALGMVVWGLAPGLVNLAQSNLPAIADMISDPLAKASIKAPVVWSGWEWLIGAGFLAGMGAGIRLIMQRRYLVFVYLQLGLTLTFVNLMFAFVAPKIAEYSQGAPLAFFKQIEQKDAYVMTAGYKSYLPYFYSKVRPHTHEQALDIEWLINGEIDKDVYMATKITKIDAAFKQRYRQFERLHEAGGFVFFRRKSLVELKAGN